MNFSKLINVSVFLLWSLQILQCAEPGEDGSNGIDCGEFGSAHDGHCHCDDGYAFDGTTCVSIEQITEPCIEDVDNDTDEDHVHSACLCVEVQTCPCDGTLTTYANHTYCVPVLHDEEQ